MSGWAGGRTRQPLRVDRGSGLFTAQAGHGGRRGFIHTHGVIAPPNHVISARRKGKRKAHQGPQQGHHGAGADAHHHGGQRAALAHEARVCWWGGGGAGLALNLRGGGGSLRGRAARHAQKKASPGVMICTSAVLASIQASSACISASAAAFSRTRASAVVMVDTAPRAGVGVGACEKRCFVERRETPGRDRVMSRQRA